MGGEKVEPMMYEIFINSVEVSHDRRNMSTKYFWASTKFVYWRDNYRRVLAII